MAAAPASPSSGVLSVLVDGLLSTPDRAVWPVSVAGEAIANTVGGGALCRDINRAWIGPRCRAKHTRSGDVQARVRDWPPWAAASLRRGLGVASVAATAIGTDVAETLGGIASGLLNTGAQLGTAVGVAVLLVLAASVNQPWPGTAQAWIVAAAIAGATALSLLVARRGNASRADAITEGKLPSHL
jgi:hypothetical protein